MSDIGALIEKLIRIRDSSDMSCEERDQLADAYSVLAVYKKFHRIPTEETVPDASSDLENLLVDCAQLINVIKQEWEQVGGWSHWDQSVLNRITLALVNLSAPAQEGMREALKSARCAIATLDDDDLGYDHNGLFRSDPDYESWPIKLALLAKIDNALSAPAEPAGRELMEEAASTIANLMGAVRSLRVGIRIHNELPADAPARLNNIEGPVVSALFDEAHEARATLSKLRTALGEK